MYVPEGMTEKEVLEVISRTVRYLAPSFKFGYFDAEDMKQEGTIFCIEAMKSFNFDKSCQNDKADALFTFLKTHVRWRFLNMRRKSLSRVEPPSCECELCKNDSSNRLDCRKYSNWVKRNGAKRSLMEPFNVLSVRNTDASEQSDINERLLSSEIIAVLNEHVSASLRADYRRFIEGHSISRQRKNRLIKHIKEILANHYNLDCEKNENR